MPPTEVVRLAGLPRMEWLDARRRGIGSSDVAAICGLDKYRSPTAVYFDKVGDADPEDENVRMRLGRKMEALIASEWEEQMASEGVTVAAVRPPALYAHHNVEWAFASPDWLATPHGQVEPLWGDVLGLLECKTYTGRGDEWDDSPPARVVLQTTWQMFVTEQRTTWVGLLAHGREYRQWRVDYNESVAGPLVELVAEFWGHVLRHEPPPADDGHPATAAALQQIYKVTEVDSRVTLTDDQAETVRALTRAKEATKVAQAEEDRLANVVRATLGNAEVGVLGDGRDAVTWKPSAEFDVERFAKEHPLLAAKYQRLAKADLKADHPNLYRQFSVARAGSRRLNLKKGIE